MVLKLDMIQTVALAMVVLTVGNYIRKKANFLEKYCIPAPVIGGLIFAIMALVLRQTGILVFEMNTVLQDFFMTAFFTTIGFTASFRLLRKGGFQVIIFLILAVVLVIFQDIVGVALAKVFDLNPLIGLCTGSVPMTGGHGTSGSFAPMFESAGAIGATTVAMASATFGLVMGSMIGGPIGKRLIEKNNLTSRAELEIATDLCEEDTDTVALNSSSFMTGIAQILFAMGIGTIISMLLQMTGLKFPSYVGAMFAGAIIRNISDMTNLYEVKLKEISVFGDVSLTIFLAMALMGLKLWELADLAVPMIVMLLAQTLLMATFAYYITFNLMGRDYDAAVMACGHCGFGMGATPNAMANMSTITSKYLPAPKAFFILPLVGSLFIDFINIMVITFFMNLF